MQLGACRENSEEIARRRRDDAGNQVIKGYVAVEYISLMTNNKATAIAQTSNMLLHVDIFKFIYFN